MAFFANWNADDFIAAFTGLTFFVFAGQLWQMWRQNQHFRVTERAYVKMSHDSSGRDGLQLTANGFRNIRAELKNCGRTPARISSMFLDVRVLRHGEMADFVYRDGGAVMVQAFVMPGESVIRNWEFRLTPAQETVIDAPEEGILIIYGYVDYRDQFGDRYRSGYGRQFIPTVQGNNLGFPEIDARLNFDDLRMKGAGMDWEEE